MADRCSARREMTLSMSFTQSPQFFFSGKGRCRRSEREIASNSLHYNHTTSCSPCRLSTQTWPLPNSASRTVPAFEGGGAATDQALDLIHHLTVERFGQQIAVRNPILHN